jgi:hypothetical protein
MEKETTWVKSTIELAPTLDVSFSRIHDVTVATITVPSVGTFRGYAIKNAEDDDIPIVGKAIAMERALEQVHRGFKRAANKARRC